MVKELIALISILTLFIGDVSPQSLIKKDLLKKEQELKRLKAEISLIENKIKENAKKEKKELSDLDEYDEQLQLIKQLINNLEDEEKDLNKEIEFKKSEISKAEQELSKLRTDYANHIVNLYKYGRKSDWELLLTSKSLNQAAIRVKYLQKFSEDRLKQINAIRTKAQQVTLEKIELEEVLETKANLLKQKVTEEGAISNKIETKRKIIKELKNDHQQLVKDYERKQKSAQQLNKMISDLIIQEEKEREIARQRAIERQRQKELEQKQKLDRIKELRTDKYKKEIETENPAAMKTQLDEYYEMIPNFTSFSNAKGKLPWPVSQGRIVSKFGEQRNELLNTITISYGVDISTPFGSDVRAVSDGRVSLIHWLPGFGNVIIITHSEEYRTVYAHLSEVLVREGQLVTTGDVIARSGETLDGEMIHLEIWRERERQNPEIWLARR